MQNQAKNYVIRKMIMGLVLCSCIDINFCGGNLT